MYKITTFKITTKTFGCALKTKNKTEIMEATKFNV